MRKRLLIILLVASFSSLIYAQQITNGSFENWTSGDPDSWTTSNSLYPGSITEESTAHAGNHAVRMNAVLSGGQYQVYTLVISSLPITTPPVALHGWYMFNSVNSEYLIVNVNVVDDGNSSNHGIGQTVISASQSVYKEFVSTITYQGTSTETYAGIGFSMYALNNTLDHAGTYAVIDDLSWGGTAGIDNINPGNSIDLEKVSPNPSSGNTDIIYSIFSNSKVKLIIFDITGREIKVLVNENQTSGRYKAVLNVTELSVGQYICLLDVNGEKIARKLFVIR